MDSSSNPDINENNTQGTEGEVRNPPPANNKGKRKKDVPRSGDESADRKKSKKQSSTRSDVWDHFSRTEDEDDICKCHYCKRFHGCATKSGTSNLWKHLDICKQFKAWEGRKTQSVINQQGNLQVAKVYEEVFREATNEMLVLGELPLSWVEGMAWKHLCNKVNLYTPHSRRTSSRDIIKMYVARKASLKELVSGNQCRVSLTTDIWVANTTGASYMGSYNLKGLLECLAEWGIEKIFTITVDNATANTSALRKFQSAFQDLRSDSLVLNGEYMHMRCCAHIINLIVQDGLDDLGANVAAIRNGVQYVRSSTPRLNSFEQKVLTGKMTRGSLPMDIKTRWNSTYLMLTRAMKYKLAFDKMEAEDKLYNEYFLEVENGKKRIGPPTTSDWKAVERLVKFLGLFYTATLVVSASTNVCSHKRYGEIVTIEKNLMGMSISYDKDLSKKAETMREKFSKYWDGMRNINRLLIIASVFDPRQKMQFAKMCFEKLYGADSSDAKEMYNFVYAVMVSLFNEYSINCREPNTQPTQPNPSPSGTAQELYPLYSTSSHEFVVDDVLEFERMDRSFKELVNEKVFSDPNDELEIYLKEEVENPKTIPGIEWDVLSWWRVNSHKYPVLSEIAKSVLAMQVFSVASESAFSTSGRIIEPSRSCLTHYTVEALICTEQWLKCELSSGEKTVITNAQMLADIELLDNLEKEFQTEGNLN